ncbi:MAG: tRNA-modifying protein YgfZ [Psychromonas sp.]|nr:tRNA-modifying protein YgfZ [Psychromonas sp.]
MLELNQLENISHLPDLVLCPLDSWDLICVQGEQRIEFLQGQLTCDLKEMKPGDQTLAAQCDPHGKVWSILRVLVLEDRILLTQPSSVTKIQLPELQKYAGFSKVEIKKETEFKAFGLAGSKSAQYITNKIDIAATHNKSQLLPAGGILIKQPYPSLRYLVVLQKDIAKSLIDEIKDSIAIFDDSLWNAMNIASGIAFICAETSNKYTPQMLNLQLLDGICYTKGCYIGQENIAREKYRGANKRSLFILTGRATATPKAGDNVEILIGENYKRIGNVVSGCKYGDGHIEVLAVLPSDTNENKIYHIKEIEASTLYYTALPYQQKQD